MPVLQGLQDQSAHSGLPAPRVPLAPPVRRDLRVHRVRLEHKAHRVFQVLQVPPGLLVPLVLPGQLDQLAPLVPPVLLALRGQPAPLVLLGQPDLPVLPVRQV